MIVAALAAALAGLLALGLGRVLGGPLLPTAGLVLLLCAFVFALGTLHGTARPLSAIPAAAILLVAGELGFAPARGGPGSRRERLAWLAGCALAAGVVALVIVALGAVAPARSAGLTVAGVAAAVAAVGLLVAAARAAAHR